MKGLAVDERGLLPAVVQDRLTGQVRMLGYMDAEALRMTLETGRATFYSRSRARLWVKGETSGHYLSVRSVIADCDKDALLLLVDPEGPTCHTGRASCFFYAVASGGEPVAREADAGAFIQVLEETIASRRESSAEPSYTRELLAGPVAKIGDKLREEADELALAIREESAERVAAEAADLVYHVLVGLNARGIGWRDVLAVLASRHGTSGLVEKANRARP